VFGVIVGVLCIFLDRFSQIRTLLPFLTGLICGFLSFAISTATTEFCPFATALAGIVWLLPGLTFAIAVAELSARCIIAGSSRFFGAVVVALQQGFGLAIGSRLVLWSPINTDEIVNGCPITHAIWYAPIFLTLALTSFNILLNNRPSQWLPTTAAALVGWSTFYALSKSGFGILDTSSAVAVAALGVGVTGQLVAMCSHHQSLVAIIGGILVLVPGGLGVRGATSVFSQKGVDGLSFGLNNIMVGFSITMGLMVAKALIPSHLPTVLFRPTRTAVPIM
jgi:uncharacterized membrane protein YjjB (DUF3815 family)